MMRASGKLWLASLRSFIAASILILAAVYFHPVFAHRDEPRLEINSDLMNPGGVIEVRGVHFESEEQISLTLAGTDIKIPLEEFGANAEGMFSLYITLPVDLREGVYHFVALTDDHEILVLL